MALPTTINAGGCNPRMFAHYQVPYTNTSLANDPTNTALGSKIDDCTHFVITVIFSAIPAGSGESSAKCYCSQEAFMPKPACSTSVFRQRRAKSALTFLEMQALRRVD
jgi:hypothetical protein